MKNQKTIGLALLVIGIVLLFISLAADVIGIGSGGGFGFKQIAGSAAGLILAILGFVLYSRQKTA